MNILDELKKLGSRLTGEENETAIAGQSLAEVFGYVAGSLNVNADGKLVASEYVAPVKPSEPSAGGNLLSAPITIAEIWNDTSGPVVTTGIGLEVGKNYKVTGYYGTAKTPFEYDTTTIAGADDIMPIPEGGSFTRLVMANIPETGGNSGYFSIDCIDCVEFTGEGLVYNAEIALLACGYSGSDANRDLYRDIVIESITEA